MMIEAERECYHESHSRKGEKPALKNSGGNGHQTYYGPDQGNFV